MKLKITIIFLFINILSISSCKKITDPIYNFNVADEDLVAFTAVFNETDADGNFASKLVLADYNNPSYYKIITDNNYQAIKPLFSRDKTKLLFNDKASGWEPNPQFALYDIKKETIKILWEPRENTDDFPVLGFIAVWNYEDTGFYFSVSPPPFSIAQNVLLYDLESQKIEMVHNGKGYSVYPRALKGQDTLIVFSNNTLETGEPIGFYFMSLNGNYISRINNHHLESIIINGVTKKGTRNPQWSNLLKAFVFSEIDSLVPGYKISITDLYGNYYKSFTSGQYIDDYPVWGPDGKTILFDRRDLRTLGEKNKPHKIMILDVQSGKIKEFLKASTINGAYSLRYPAY